MNPLHVTRVLIRIVELAGFMRAAKRPGMSASAATCSTPALEAHQNVRLLDRSTPKMALTDAGREYLESATAVTTRRLHR